MWEKINLRICKYDYCYSNEIMKTLISDIDKKIEKKINEMTEKLINDADFSKWFSEEVIRQLREVNIIEQIQTAIPPQQRLEDLELHRDTNMTLNNAINRGKYIAIFMDRISKPKK